MIRRHRDDPHATVATIDAGELGGEIIAADPALAQSTPDHSDAAPARTSGPLLRRVAQFVLLERLGSGGMGVVYAAFDDKLERKVAIKLVATQGGGERAQARLLREAQSQGQLSHPNVVTIYEVGKLPEGQLFIAMELVKGQTLRTWQDGTRSWQDIVATYAAAGEGLAAAHRANIVHRDFKPDNVLIGDDSRVRVTDFGLAFAATAAGPASDAGSRAASVEAAGEPATARETAAPDPGDAGATDAATPAGLRGTTRDTVGGLAGTPGYMAPEQLAGTAVDARADQFAFCVALYEALHGERPSANPEFAHGERPDWRRAAPDASYPRWLWDLVMRGLAHQPGERFASMNALLVELNRHRQQGRRRTLLGVALAATVATAGITYAASGGSDRPPVCPPATAQLDKVWDSPTKQRIKAALLGTRAPFAASVWASTEVALDRYATRWLAAQHAACEDTNVRHIQSADLLDRRTECLEARRRSLAAATDVLVNRPVQAASHAGEILNSLGDIDLCADTGVLLALGQAVGAGTAALVDPQLRRRVADVRSDLAQATALLATGEVDLAAPKVDVASQRAAQLAQPAVIAEARFAQGQVQLARSEVAKAIGLFKTAIALAVSSHHDELAADVYLTLAMKAGSLEQRPAEIESWMSQGEAWMDRLGHPSDPRRIVLERARGWLQLTAGDPRNALVTVSRALQTAEALWGNTDPRLSQLLSDRAVIEARLGQAKLAVADGERSLALAVQAWGPTHPSVLSMRRALGLVYIEQLGDVKRGEAEITTALQLYRSQLGDDSVEVANCEQALSQAGQYVGDYAVAIEHAERAEKIFAHQLGADNPRRVEALIGLGVLRFMRKDFAGSLADYEAAYPLMLATLGADHASVGVLLSNIGEALLALGRSEAAEADFEKALPILQKGLGPDHADLALPLKGLGLARLQRGHPHDALAPLERALALRTQANSASDPQEIAEIQWGLARTLRTLGREPTRAHELAEAALAGYRRLGDQSAERVGEISRWLNNRSVSP